MNLMFFPWMQFFARMVFPRLISWIWLLNGYIVHVINPEHGATCCSIKSEKRSNAKTKIHSNPMEDPGLTNGDDVTSNAKLSRFCACLKKFEDNHVDKADTGGKTRAGERVVAKWQPVRNPVSKTLNRSRTVPSSSSSQSPRNLTANCSTLDSFGTEEAGSDGFEKGQHTRLSSMARRYKPEL